MRAPRLRCLSLSPLRLLLVLALLLGSALAGCDDDPAGSVAGTAQVVVEFVPQVDGQDLVQGQLIYTNAAGQDYSVTRLQYLITDVRLHRASGSSVPVVEALLGNSFDNKIPAASDVPGGTYAKVSFQWGKEWGGSREATETLDPVFDFLLWPAMNGGGYHCMRFEGDYTAVEPGDQSFKLHMGRLERFGIVTETSVPVELDFANSVVLKDGETWTIRIAIELNHFLNDPVYDFTERVVAPGGREFWCANPADPECDGLAPMHGPIMPNHVAQQRLLDNVADVFSLRSVGGGMAE